MTIKKEIQARNVLRVALYVRVSTQEQANEGYSIGEQIERLKNYCKAMGWEIYKIYTDPGYSGGDTNRPGLKEMMKDVEAGEVDKVVVYKLDRLSRSQKDTLILIEDVFLANNVDFVSMSENFDTSTPIGRAVLGLLAVFAQLERDQIKERMGMGKEARAKEGKWHGGSTDPIGYDYNPDTEELKVNDYEILQVRELFDLFINYTPLRTIERKFNEKGYTHKYGTWDPKSMRRVLANKVYIGYIKHRDEWYPGLQDKTIDLEVFDKAQEILKIRAENYVATGNKPGAQTTYLGGLLHCKHCGGKYAKTLNSRYKEGKPKVYWYSCYSRSKKVKKMIKDPTCKNKNWKMVELDEMIFNEIKKLAMYPDYMKKIKTEQPKPTDTPDKITILKNEIEKLDAQISRFMDLYGIGKFTIDQVSSKVDPLNEARDGLQRELDKLNAEAGRLSEEEARKIIESFSEILEQGDFGAIRTVIELLINYIVIDNEKIYIYWNFV